MADLTIELLLHTPFAPNDELLTDAILRASRLIDGTPNGLRREYLYGVYRTLLWARSGGDGFADPMENPNG